MSSRVSYTESVVKVRVHQSEKNVDIHVILAGNGLQKNGWSSIRVDNASLDRFPFT